MKRLRPLLVLTILGLPSIAVSTEELFEDVDYDMTRQLIDRNEIFFEEIKYFAAPNRVRIVQVNSDLLMNEGSVFSVTPFADRSIVVRSDGIAVDRQGNPTSRWKGMQIPTYARTDSRKFDDPYFKVNLTVRQRLYNPATGDSVSFNPKYHRSSSIEGTEAGGISGLAFSTEPYEVINVVTGTINIENAGPIRLVTFPSNAKYSVLWEEDPVKADIFEDRWDTARPQSDRTRTSEDEARAERARQFREHMRAVEERIQRDEEKQQNEAIPQ